MHYDSKGSGATLGGTDQPVAPDLHWTVRLMVWDWAVLSKFRSFLWFVVFFAVGMAQLFRPAPEPVIGAFYLTASLPMFAYWLKGRMEWGLFAYSMCCVVSLARSGSAVVTYLMGEGTWHGSLITGSAWLLIGMNARTTVAYMLRQWLGLSVCRSY